jgi:hypothetical protein
MRLDNVKKLVQMTQQFNAIHKDAVQRDAYEHRFKNLSIALVFCGFFGGSLTLAYWQRFRFDLINRYVLFIVLGFLFLCGMVMVINYLVIIFKKR